MRELNRNEIGQVSGASSTGSNAWVRELSSAKIGTGAWTAQLTSVNKSIPMINEVLNVINNLFGLKIPFLNR